jgi:hypothetical protein
MSEVSVSKAVRQVRANRLENNEIGRIVATLEEIKISRKADGS